MSAISVNVGRTDFSVCAHRGQRLEESLEYQQFVANVEEEEAWINEKMTLVASEDYGDTLAAIQVGEAEGATCFLSWRCLWSPFPRGFVLFPGHHTASSQGPIG